MPTSISSGRATTRPTTSAATSRAAPATAENGSSQRWSVPTSSRHRCGTTSPTKAIGPATAVAAPQRMTAPTADDQPGAGDVLAEPGGEVVAEGERVHAARGDQADERADREERQHERDAIPGRAADAADLPEAEGLHDVDAGEQDRADQRAERRRGRGAGERELQRGGAAAAERADDVDEDRGDRRAGDRHADDTRTGRTAPKNAMPITTASAAPRGDAEDAGVGERVAGDRLHRRRPTIAERGADEDREHRARNPRDDGGLGDAVAVAAERRRRSRRARPARAPKRDRRHAQQREHADGGGEPGQPHRRRAPQRWRRPAAACASGCALTRPGSSGAGEQGEVVVDAPADRQRRRVRRGGERGRVLEDRDRALRRSPGSATAAGRPAAASMIAPSASP